MITNQEKRRSYDGHFLRNPSMKGKEREGTIMGHPLFLVMEEIAPLSGVPEHQKQAIYKFQVDARQCQRLEKCP